jgi:cell division protein FtsI/penicillin-binding protein 2
MYIDLVRSAYHQLHAMRSNTSNFRIRILGGVFIAFALLLVLRLYFVQIVHGDQYRKDAMGQYVSPDAETESRSSIFFSDRSGRLVAAAVMRTGWRIAISPKTMQNADDAFEKLSDITKIDRERFFASAKKANDPYEEIAFRISDADASKIRSLKIPGIILVQDQWRFYPGNELGAHALGFVGYKGDTKEGVYGLEREYDDTLVQKVSGTSVNPFAEIFANAQALLSSNPAAYQGSIVTSIEPNVERQLELVLDGVMKTYTPKFAGGIIMDPHTGEIVAIAMRPAFDPNTYNLVSNPAIFSNPLIEGRYEMGSIVKPLTLAIGIDAGAITPETTYNDKGCITRSGKKICNFDFKARGVVPMQEILNQSLNLGVTFVVDKVGHENFTRYLEKLELDKKSGVDLPNEVVGTLESLSNGTDVDFASASFGQGIAVSPVGIIRSLSVLANDGVLPRPHVVTGIRYENGVIRAIKPSLGTQVISSQSAETVTTMLVKVFDEALLKGVLKQERHSIAAKTGTAQLAIPGGGGYYTDRFLHSFFGYFPAHEPKFIVFLFAVEPHGAEFASATLARPFVDLTKYLINYYQIPPDR